MFIKDKYNSTLCTLTQDMSFTLAGQNHIGSYVVKEVFIHNPENKSNWVRVTEEAHYCMVLLLQQGGLAVFNIYHLEFQHFKNFNLVIKVSAVGT
jgi:hypothetical protein